MGAYDSKRFSKEFSERTERNMIFISRVVNKEKLEKESIDDFLESYEKVIRNVEELEKELRNEANNITNVQRKGKNELKTKIHAIANRISDARKVLKQDLSTIIDCREVQKDYLYEITQKLNSLLGIAVLPYEMHKEYFKRVENDKKSDTNKELSLRKIQNTVKRDVQYNEFLKYIINLYDQDKWYTSYDDDLNEDRTSLCEDRIVFGFLGHIRNAVCHSGDNALSILPLDEGRVIEYLLFYDTLKGQEFAMKLSINELDKLISHISEFYSNTSIGSLDKTKAIANAESNVEKLLKKNVIIYTRHRTNNSMPFPLLTRCRKSLFYNHGIIGRPDI